MNQKNQDRDSYATHEVKKIGRTTYFINHSFIGKYQLEKILLRLILSDNPCNNNSKNGIIEA